MFVEHGAKGDNHYGYAFNTEYERFNLAPIVKRI